MTRALKSYKNGEFLASVAARPVRILCEYEEPRHRFLEQDVRDTIVVFGSARIVPRDVAEARLEAAERNQRLGDGEPEKLEFAVKHARKQLRLARYYEDARELSRRLTEWSIAQTSGRKYLVATGGGPGIMEAGNRGAADVPNGRSVGLGISLPFEEQSNKYITPELNFEFHYFFMRKYWFIYLAKALVVFPGGFGTLDEFSEVLTLRQTGKVRKAVPIVLFGTEYWSDIINFEKMAEWGTIKPEDMKLFHRTDSVDDAFEYLVNALEHGDRTGFGMLPVPAGHL